MTNTQDISYEQKPSSQLSIVQALDWINTEPPEPDPVVANLFEIGDKFCVIGGPKTNKTWFLLQMALCICEGVDFLGLTISKPRRVVFLQLEVSGKHFHRRFKMATEKIKFGTTGAEKLRIVNGRGLDLDESLIKEAVAQAKAEVLIIDPIYKLIDGDENTAQAFRNLLSMFDRIASQTGVAIVYAHHDGKGIAGTRIIQDRGAGSNVLARDYDACITLTPHEQEGLQVIEMLTRNYPQADPFTVSWDKGVFHLRENIPPRVMRGTTPNKNPTTDIPCEHFFSDLKAIVEDHPGIMKTDLFDRLKTQRGLTKDKTNKVIAAAVESEVICTNHGRGVGQKRIVFATNQEALEQAMKNLVKQQPNNLFCIRKTQNEKHENPLNKRPF